LMFGCYSDHGRLIEALLTFQGPFAKTSAAHMLAVVHTVALMQQMAH